MTEERGRGGGQDWARTEGGLSREVRGFTGGGGSGGGSGGSGGSGGGGGGAGRQLP